MPALRARFAEASARHPDDATFLRAEEVRAFFAQVFTAHNQAHPASSERFLRCLLLEMGPRLDENETTDKGYINQAAVLRHRTDDVERLYRDEPDTGVIVLT
jgi:feruloyl-CoA synthase